MKNLALILPLLAGCGAVFSDDAVEVTVVAPKGAVIYLDGMKSHDGSVMVDAHKRHTFTATAADGGPFLGTCLVEPSVQPRYVIGDVFLIEMVFPIVIDIVTDDWGVIQPTTCSF